MPTFDGEALIMTLDPAPGGVANVDVQNDLYEPWKDWMLSTPLNRRYPALFRPDGGNPLSSIIDQGRYTFLNNVAGWRIKPYEQDGTWYLTGNLAVEDTELPAFLPTDGDFTAAILGLQPVTQGVTPEMKEQLEHASFNDGVSIDVLSPYSGTAYPNGTPRTPVNNIDDAVAIADLRGFYSLFILGDLHLTSAIPDLSRYTFVGAGKDRTNLMIDADANVEDCTYYDAHVSGTLDGDSRLKDCLVSNLIYVKGYIEQCVLSPGTIVLAGTETANFLDCWSGVPDPSIPIIDLGGSGQSLALQNYNGVIKLINKTGPEVVTINLNSGHVELDPTLEVNTAGSVIVRGLGTLEDNSTGAYKPNINGLVSQEVIDNIKYLVETLRPHHTGFGSVIYWDPVLGNDANNAGNVNRAVKTFSRAHDIAGDGKHDIIVCVSSDAGQTVVDEHLTITKNYLFVRGPGRDFMIKPTTSTGPTVTIDAVGVELSGFVVETAATGFQPGVRVLDGADFFFLENMWIHYTTDDGVQITGNGVYGRINQCFMSHLGEHGIHINGNVRHVRITSTEIDDPALDGIRIEGTTARNNIVGPHVTIYAAGGHAVHLEAPARRNLIHGDNEFYDNALGNVFDNGVDTVIQEDVVQASMVDALWDEPTAGHLTDGTFGHFVQKKLLKFASYIGLK